MRSLRKVSWRATCGAFCLAGGALAVQPSQAAEYGLGNYLLGLSLPMTGYTPPPGLYFVTEKFAVDIATLAWFTNVDVIGATFGLGITRISLRRSSAA